MSQQEWQQLSLGFHLEPCSGGKKRERSKRLRYAPVSGTKRLTDNGDTTSTQLSINDAANKPAIIYARVSSYAQKADIERQVQFLMSQYPGCEVIRDIGSGTGG